MDLTGIDLPNVQAPVAAYTPAVRTGNLVFTSGQLPFVADGEGRKLLYTGTVGEDVTTEQAYDAARASALNALAAVQSIVPLEQVTRIVKAVVFVNSAPDYTDQSTVGNGASDLFKQVFGESGVHARSAIGLASLPQNSPTEVEIIVEVKD